MALHADPLPPPQPRTAPPRVLSIAGTDSGGGAGIQADSRTFTLSGVHAMVAVAAVTVQNSVGVSAVHTVPTAVVEGQIRAVVGDIGLQAAKTGMLASSDIVTTVARVVHDLGIGRAGSIPLLVDPVCASMHGDSLLAEDAFEALRRDLIPQATIVTPNLDEVRLITGIDVVDNHSQRQAATELHAMGAQWALVKGGHLRSSPSSTDILFNGSQWYSFPTARIDTPHDHGGGDTLGSAIVSALAHGRTVPEAVAYGKWWVTRCLEWAYPLGNGHGPVSPLWRIGNEI